MVTVPASPARLDEIAESIDGWLAQVAEENPLIEAVDRDETGVRRWFVRMAGEQRDHTTVWLHLRQRTLYHESYVLPAPVDDVGAFYEHLLRRNHSLRGLGFSVGPEDAVYLVGEIPNDPLQRDDFDEILGMHHDAVERCFRPALRIGFASLLAR